MTYFNVNYFVSLDDTGMSGATDSFTRAGKGARVVQSLLWQVHHLRKK